MSNKNLKLNYKELKEYMKQDKKDKFTSHLFNIFVNNIEDLSKPYQLYEDFIRENPSFALDKCYFSFRKKVERVLPSEDLMQMDNYFFKKYILSKPERLITSFRGTAMVNFDQFNGILFLTPFRIIGLGNLITFGGWMKFRMEHDIFGIFYMGDKLGIGASNIMAGASALLEAELGEDPFKFQFFIPIMKIHYFKRKKSHISFYLRVSFMTKKELKKVDIPIKIRFTKERDETYELFYL